MSSETYKRRRGNGGDKNGAQYEVEPLQSDAKSEEDEKIAVDKPETQQAGSKNASLSLALIGLLESADAGHICVISAFLPFMVAAFEGIHESELGFRCGAIQSAYSCGQVMSNYLWGYVSDRWLGSKYCLLLGLIISSVCLFLFGFSTTFWQALLLRGIAGLMNGNSAILKSFMGKITTSENQKSSVTCLLVSFGIGATLAHFIGGMFSEPAAHHPHWFSPSGIFAQYPYALPCLIVASYLVVICVIAAVFLENPEERFEYRAVGEAGKGDVLEEDFEMNFRVEGKVKSGWINVSDDKKEVYEKVKSEEDELEVMHHHRDSPFLRNMLITTLMYSWTGFLYSMIEEVIPLFSKLSIAKGGLAYTTQQLGVQMTIQGASMIFVTLGCLSMILRKIGVRQSLRISFLGVIPFLFVFPVMNLIAEKNGSNQDASITVMFALSQSLRCIFSGCAFGSIILMINNSVPDSHLGQANGLGQSFAAIFRLLAPLISGSLFSYIYYSLGAFACSRWLIWVIISAVSFMGYFSTFLLDESLEDTYAEAVLSRQNSRANMLKHSSTESL